MNEPNLSDAPLRAELERMRGLSRRRPFRGSGPARATAMLATRGDQLILPPEQTMANSMFVALDTDQGKRYNIAFAKVSGA